MTSSWDVKQSILTSINFFFLYRTNPFSVLTELTESLISVAVLLETVFDVLFRIPTDDPLDGVDPIIHPDYGGHITTPDG